MTILAATLLTLSAALWRVLDGRGIPPKTTIRNAVGLAIALAAVSVNFGPEPFFTPTASKGYFLVAAVLAWASLVVGFTKWESWWSLARYGVPTAAIALLASTVADPVACALYSLGGVLVGILYRTLHNTRDFGWNTAVCEVAAGAVIVGGLAWL